MKNAYAKNQAELRRQLLNYGALVGQQFMQVPAIRSTARMR